MRSFRLLLLLSLVSVAAACSDRGAPPAASPEPVPASNEDAAAAVASEPEATPITEWDAASVTLIHEMVDKLRAGGLPCGELEIARVEMYAADYAERLGQVPLAEGSCMTPFSEEEEEDITFYVFDSGEALARFMGKKQHLLCRNALKYDLAHFPGYPYVKGETWFIQPDERETAEKIARIVGGTAGVAACKDGKPVADPGPADPAADAAAPVEGEDADERIVIVFAEADPDWGPAPLDVQFKISDPYNHLIEPTFHWDFGDGRTSDKRSPRHTYTKPGEYTAKLKVVDGGAEDEDEVEITVEGDLTP